MNSILAFLVVLEGKRIGRKKEKESTSIDNWMPLTLNINCVVVSVDVNIKSNLNYDLLTNRSS